jgi:hypothetical protein
MHHCCLGRLTILARARHGVTYKDVDSDWKLDLFALLITTTNHSKCSAVITAWTTLKAHSIFTLWELAFLPSSRLLGTMPKALASTDFSLLFLYFELSLSWKS